MTLLRIDSSIQGPRSTSSELPEQVVAGFQVARPSEPVITRHLAKQPLPSDAWQTAVLVTTRGGDYGPGSSREGWDHNSGYLRRILGDLWDAELIVIERELTLAGLDPAMDELSGRAAALTKIAEQAALDAGRELAA